MPEKKEGSWDSRHDILSVLKGKGANGWFQVIVGKRKDNEKRIIRMKRFRNWYSIPSKEDYIKLKNMFMSAAVSIGWELGNNSSVAVDELVSQTTLLTAERNKTKEQEQKLRDTASKLRDKISEYQMALQAVGAETWKKDLEDFELLLSKAESEKEIQGWLYDHPWIFGPYYIEASKEDITRDNDRIDFLLQRHDKFYDVVELKLPSCKIFDGVDAMHTSPSRENPMSTEVKNAISQVIKYIEEYELDKTSRQFTRGQLIHKPKAIIVMGRADKNNKTALKTLNHYLYGIEILTYDDMLSLGKELIAMFERAKKPKRHPENK